MKAVVCYSASQPRLKSLADGIRRGLESKGHRVELLDVTNSTKPISMMQYDLILVGSESIGIFGGKISESLSMFISKCSRMEGKKAAAFIPSGGIGVSKSLGALMKLIETQGAIIIDFASLSKEKDSIEFGARLKF